MHKRQKQMEFKTFKRLLDITASKISKNYLHRVDDKLIMFHVLLIFHVGFNYTINQVKIKHKHPFCWGESHIGLQ
jgi:hypothetical protein